VVHTHVLDLSKDVYSLSRSPQNKYASTVVYIIDFMSRRGELNSKKKSLTCIQITC